MKHGKHSFISLAQRLFHRAFPAAQRRDTGHDGLYRLLAPSLVAVCLCAVGLCGSTFAWFTAHQSTGVSTIRSGNFQISVTVDSVTDTPTVTAYAATSAATYGVTDDAAVAAVYSLAAAAVNEPVTVDTGVYTGTLTAGTYQVTITATGTASKGYCEVKLGDETYYTPLIKDKVIGGENEKGTFTFTVQAHEGVLLTITPQWGAVPTGEDVKIINSEDALVFGTATGTTDTSDTGDDNDDENADANATGENSGENSNDNADDTNAPSGENSDSNSTDTPDTTDTPNATDTGADTPDTPDTGASTPDTTGATGTSDTPATVSDDTPTDTPTAPEGDSDSSPSE